MTPVRILVTGSRTWDDVESIEKALQRALVQIPTGTEVTLVHGDCPTGADRIAKDIWLGWITAGYVPWKLGIEYHPADWHRLGKSAGPIRNAEMVASGIDFGLSFIRDDSPGATHCTELMAEARIPHNIYRRYPR